MIYNRRWGHYHSRVDQSRSSTQAQRGWSFEWRRCRPRNRRSRGWGSHGGRVRIAWLWCDQEGCTWPRGESISWVRGCTTYAGQFPGPNHVYFYGSWYLNLPRPIKFKQFWKILTDSQVCFLWDKVCQQTKIREGDSPTALSCTAHNLFFVSIC